ncbi:peptidase M56, partial [Pseudoflavonifractor phocaeensis]|nr:peptidase M56 [Pseudoflavonifractor phocaeensis]
FVSFGQISLAYGAGTGESAIYRGMVQEVSLRQVRREENGGFREVLKCRDEGALTDYLASLPLSEIVDGGDDFYGKEGEEIVLLYDAPEDILSVMLWDDYIRVMPFWENRAYYYHVSGGLDWETLNQLLGEPA